MASDQGRQEILQKVIEWANEKLLTDELNNQLLFASDNQVKLSYGSKYSATWKIWDGIKKTQTKVENHNEIPSETESNECLPGKWGSSVVTYEYYIQSRNLPKNSQNREINFINPRT